MLSFVIYIIIRLCVSNDDNDDDGERRCVFTNNSRALYGLVKLTFKVCAIDDVRRCRFKKGRRKYEKEGKWRLIATKEQVESAR